MNLLIYTENHVFGGGNKYMLNFINALNIDFNITLISNKNGLSRKELNQIDHKIRYYELNILSYNYMFKNYYILNIICKVYFKIFTLGKKNLIKYISNNNKNEFEKIFIHNKSSFDFVFAFNGGFPGATSCLDLLSVATKYNVGSLLSIVSMPMDKNIFTNYYKNTLNNINYFVVNCLAIKNSLFKKYNIPLNKIFVITQFVDLPILYKNHLHDKNSLKLGFVGRIEKGKGIFILLKAFKELNKKYSNISLEIYGKNYLKFWQKLYIKLYYKNINIHFNGMFNSIDQVYNSIDLLILPSFWEGLPFVILESMSYGVPVIASEVGGISEVVIPDYNGYLIKKNSYKSLFNIIDNFEKSSYYTYSNNSRKFISENYTDIPFQQNIDSLFSRLISDNIK